MFKSLIGFIVALMAVGTALSQSYPNRAVRIIVPAGTGGPDIVARVVAAELQNQLGQPFVVENRPGANGIIGADVVAKAPGDGHTLMVYSSGFVINAFVHKKLPYDTEKDFVPVTNLVSSGGLFIAVHPALPANTLQEFLALARKPDAKLSYSSPGVGNTWHLAMEVFNSVAGTKLQHVPYKGGGPATAAVASGEVQAIVASPAPLMPHYKSGKVRVLAYSAPTRNPLYPDVPTTAEAGLPAYNVDGGWFGMFAPASTPPEIVNKIQREVKTAIDNPKVRERLVGMGVQPVGNSPAEFRKFFSEEMRIHADMVRIAGIQPE
jgi:tripartite-type tricarboxylate transporter receptor subunit TctC